MQWRVELLGGLQAAGDGRVLTRFRSQRIGLLLAYLAYHRDRPHRREALIELLWPECDPATGRLNLRVALSLLRLQLARPEAPIADARDVCDSVLLVNRASVQMDPACVTTDVAEFEDALRLAAQAEDTEERARCLDWAVGLYRGEFLPGYYEEWVL
jgi:DNA-binding SARP family transcriptional activator